GRFPRQRSGPRVRLRLWPRPIQGEPRDEDQGRVTGLVVRPRLNAAAVCCLNLEILPMLLPTLALALTVVGQGPSEWYEPFPAHKIVGNVYYVGSRDLATYLITTPKGHILINSGFDRTVPLIQKSVESLGFKMTDVKILLASHAHSDHVAGHA